MNRRRRRRKKINRFFVLSFHFFYVFPRLHCTLTILFVFISKSLFLPVSWLSCCSFIVFNIAEKKKKKKMIRKRKEKTHAKSMCAMAISLKPFPPFNCFVIFIVKLQISNTYSNIGCFVLLFFFAHIKRE